MAIWFFAFLVKETALWLLPVWAYAIVLDARRGTIRRTFSLFAPALMLGTLLTVTYLLLCSRIWGSALARFEGVNHLTSEHAWSLSSKSGSRWLARLIWQPPLLYLHMLKVVLVPLLFAPWLVRNEHRVWFVSTVAIALFYWFGSSGVSAYSPLPILQRMILPLLPFAFVTSAIATDELLERFKNALWRTVAVSALVIALAFPSTQAIRRLAVQGQPETEAYAFLRREVAATPGPYVLVCGDVSCPPITFFHFGFTPPKNLTVVFAADAAVTPLPERATVRAIVNGPRSEGHQHESPAKDLSADIERFSFQVLYDVRGVRIYDGGDGTRMWAAHH